MMPAAMAESAGDGPMLDNANVEECCCEARRDIVDVIMSSNLNFWACCTSKVDQG